jgi:addiction module RelB/DinJ family antitoxin
MRTLLNIKIEEDLKVEAQRVASELGFPLSTLLNAYLRQLIKNKTVYFTAKSSYYMSAELEDELRDVELDIKRGRNISKAFKSSSEAIAYLKRPE